MAVAKTTLKVAFDIRTGSAQVHIRQLGDDGTFSTQEISIPFADDLFDAELKARAAMGLPRGRDF